MKIRWKTSPREMGRYASFYPRNWPSAYYADGCIAASLKCSDGMSYHASYVKSGNHSPLIVYIYETEHRLVLGGYAFYSSDADRVQYVRQAA